MRKFGKIYYIRTFGHRLILFFLISQLGCEVNATKYSHLRRNIAAESDSPVGYIASGIIDESAMTSNKCTEQKKIIKDPSDKRLNNFFKEVYFTKLINGYEGYFVQSVKRKNNGLWQVLIGGRKKNGYFDTLFDVWSNDISIESERFYVVRSKVADCVAYFIIDWTEIPNSYCFYWDSNPNDNFGDCCFSISDNAEIMYNVAEADNSEKVLLTKCSSLNSFFGADSTISINTKYEQLRKASSNKNMGVEALAILYNFKQLSSKHKFVYGFYHETATTRAGNYELDHGIIRPKDTKNAIINSAINKFCGKYPVIYGTDFDDVVGTWLKTEDREKEIASLISTIRKMYKENGAIPAFSWHLENPYIVSSHDFYNAKYDGSTYTSSAHPNIVSEILNNTGERCGFGNFSGTDDVNSYNNPRIWFLALLDEVVAILNQLVIEDVNIPVIIRLLHECNTGTFWWGKGHCSNEEYIKLYKMIVDYIKERCTNNNIMYCYNTDVFTNMTEYMSRYPSDEYIDILSYDDYSLKSLTPDTYNARIVTAIAEEHGKVPAIFEIGYNVSSLNGVTKDIYKYWYNLLNSPNVRLGFIMSWFHRLTYNDDIKEFFKGFLNYNDLIKAGDVDWKKTSSFNSIED